MRIFVYYSIMSVSFIFLPELAFLSLFSPVFSPFSLGPEDSPLRKVVFLIQTF